MTDGLEELQSTIKSRRERERDKQAVCMGEGFRSDSFFLTHMFDVFVLNVGLSAFLQR